MKFGYYLIRNPEFNNSSLIKELRKAGAETLRFDLEDGFKKYDNKERLLKRIAPGDTLVLYELTHFFKNIRELEKLTKNFQENSISLISVSEKVDTTLPCYRTISAAYRVVSN